MSPRHEWYVVGAGDSQGRRRALYHLGDGGELVLICEGEPCNVTGSSLCLTLNGRKPEYARAEARRLNSYCLLHEGGALKMWVRGVEDPEEYDPDWKDRTITPDPYETDWEWEWREYYPKEETK